MPLHLPGSGGGKSPAAVAAAEAAAATADDHGGQLPSSGGRLPPDTPPPEAEFRHTRLRCALQQLHETAYLLRSTVGTTLRQFFKPTNVAGLLASTFVVTAVGAIEGYSLLAGAAAAVIDAGMPHVAALPAGEVAAFAVTYGFEQLLASFAMATTPALDLAAVYGLDAASTLLTAATSALPQPPADTFDAWTIGFVPTPWPPTAPGAAAANAEDMFSSSSASLSDLASAALSSTMFADATADATLPTVTGSQFGVIMMGARHWAYLRMALTQVVILSQLLRMVNLGLKAREEFRARALAGRQPPMPFVTEHIVRLCGEASDTSVLSLERYGREHILPVLEHPKKIEPVVRRVSRGGDLPFLWSVTPNTYGQAHSWRALVNSSFTRHMLVQRAGGRSPVLYLEADGTNAEQALAFAGRSADLSVVDAAMAFRMLAQQSRASYRLRYVDFDVMRVFLGYPEERIATGGGYSMSAGQAMLEMGQADVVIDARVPLLIQVMRWVINTGAKEWHRTIVFATDNASSFEQVCGCEEGLG